MANTNIRATLNKDIQIVWDIVTSLENYSWRSDLREIEVLKNERGFIEHTKGGYSTRFVITAFEPIQRYEFDIENKNMTGHWVGLFSSQNGRTVIDFTENIQVKNILMKPFAKIYLKKQQAAYIRDLEQYLRTI